MRDLSYQVEIMADLSYRMITRNHRQGQENQVKIDKPVVIRNIRIGQIPVMVGSKLCRLSDKPSDDEKIELDECTMDQGGYFIIGGQEKVLVAQERSVFNQVNIFDDSSSNTPLYA
jgi:DNA-directed RNA polymerase II subunit RPB2